MPPKTKISREMILETAFRIVREEGHEAVNARRIAECLNCSTQPVMYNFRTVEEIRQEVYRMADEYHTGYIMSMEGREDSPLLAIGLNYIRFGYEEKNLFRFLFQTDQFSGMNLNALISDPVLSGVLHMVADAMGKDLTAATELFRKMVVMAHGYASLFANNALEYDEDVCRRDLSDAFKGTVKE
ncbi:MAG: TetR/AcrR family transcriptional regulator [Lachnospiraceae bacterium]|nr:TetR/AcrR family transcriptional regulator [Lachnospiraceae bacterium]